MRLLFVISHGLYLRNYGSLIRALAAAGHDVIVAKTSDKDVNDNGLHRLASDHCGVTVVRAPNRSGWWWASNDPLRAVRDYLRYLEPHYAGAEKLKDRAARRIPRLARAVFEGSGLARIRAVRRGLARLLSIVEQATPVDPAAAQWLAELRPDAVVLTPLIDFDYVQLDFLKAALARGVPSGLLVASWDNLTSKGGILLQPDLVTVWNEHQRWEAEAMHGVPRERIVVTGAQLFDQWFDMVPQQDRDAFCAQVGGLNPEQAIILYLCSSSFVCPDEVAIVRRWLADLRTAADARVRHANVIVRPHPSHAQQWHGVKLDQTGGVTCIWPPGGDSPTDIDRQRAYFDNLFHAAAVVGVNTSGFLEAAILGRPTAVLATPETAATQTGTLHFRYLQDVGILLHASTPQDHLRQLACVIGNCATTRQTTRAFVERFLRPHGLDQPALPFVIDAVTELGRRPHRAPASVPWWAWLVRAMVVPVGVAVRGSYKARLARRPAAAATPTGAGHGRTNT